jgi:hypothetical protein
MDPLPQARAPYQNAPVGASLQQPVSPCPSGARMYGRKAGAAGAAGVTGVCRRCRRLGGEGGAEDAGVFECVWAALRKALFFYDSEERCSRVVATVQQL